MDEMQLKYWKANNEFVETAKLDPDVIAIMTCGSWLSGEIDKNSDIDVFLVLDPSCDYRERGNTWIDGIEIEYFKNPPQQIRSYFKKEMKSPHTAHMLANGKLVFKNSDLIDALIVEAKEIISQGPPQIHEVEHQFALYFLDDKFKDVEDAILNNNEFGIKLLKYSIINLSIDTFCNINRIWRAKDKKLNHQLFKVNPDFASLIEAETTRNWTVNSIKNFKLELAKYLTGQREKEWCMRSKLDL